jgi:hypothetical protein
MPAVLLVGQWGSPAGGALQWLSWAAAGLLWAVAAAAITVKRRLVRVTAFETLSLAGESADAEV